MKKQKQLEVKGEWTIKLYCHCAVCNKPIGLNSTTPAFPDIAWLDPFNHSQYFYKRNKGCYVCYGCLSQKRKDEIKAAYAAEKAKA